MKSYGVPYKGSKDKIAERILSLFPSKKNFYDLFGGGGAMTCCAIAKGKFSKCHYNEFNPVVVKCFEMAMNGGFEGESRWTSHDEFYAQKDSDPYVACCFSFGNDFKSYAYGVEVAPYKKALHYATLFGDFSLIEKFYPDSNFDAVKGIKDPVERLMWLKRHAARVYEAKGGLLSAEDFKSYNNLQSFLRLENLKRMGDIKLMNPEGLKNLSVTCGSYENVDIEENSVIYCDIPYKGTNDYSVGFDYDKFYDWCGRQTEPLFISEYWMPEDRFDCVLEIEHRSLICATENQSVIERVFVPKGQKADFGRLSGALF